MSENELYEQIAQYLKLKHPGIRYHFDQSGMWTSSHKARNLYGRLNERAWPDLFIAESAFAPGTTEVYYGLFLELKREKTRIKTKAGRWASVHVEEQAEVLDGLQVAGYVAQFACGFDEAVLIIESYLSGTRATGQREAA